MRDGRMHQTTVRFSEDLWEALSEECSKLGVSAAQYVREATLTRLSYTAARRGDPEMDAALEAVVAGVGTAVATRRAQAVVDDMSPPANEQSARSAARTSELADEATALAAQTQLLVSRAQEIRDQSLRLRERAESVRQ